jgi:hypothetical protein
MYYRLNNIHKSRETDSQKKQIERSEIIQNTQNKGKNRGEGAKMIGLNHVKECIIYNK